MSQIPFEAVSENQSRTLPRSKYPRFFAHVQAQRLSECRHLLEDGRDAINHGGVFRFQRETMNFNILPFGTTFKYITSTGEVRFATAYTRQELATMNISANGGPIIKDDYAWNEIFTPLVITR